MNRRVVKRVGLLLCICMTGCAPSSFRQRIPDDSALREKIVRIAVQCEGKPYHYGENTPQGFDCSGFTLHVFKQAGIVLPRMSVAQYQTGTKVSKSSPAPGDLVFFTRWGGIGKWFPPNHVGIYIGNGAFIHAPSKGKNVRYDSLDTDYWQARLKGVRDATGIAR